MGHSRQREIRVDDQDVLQVRNRHQSIMSFIFTIAYSSRNLLFYCCLNSVVFLLRDRTHLAMICKL